jgi:hypothetical protein
MKLISGSVLVIRELQVLIMTLHELPNEVKVVMLRELERIDEEVGVSNFNPPPWHSNLV